MEFFRNTNFDFIGKRKPALLVSGIIILIGLAFVVIEGPAYGIDFLGGTSIELTFEKPVDVGEIRSSLAKIGFGKAEIKHFGAPNDILIRVSETSAEMDIAQAIEREIANDFPDNPYEIGMIEKVGPKIGSELREAAVWAVLVAMAFILVYISWRFEFMFAVGAIAALFHDVLITLGVFTVLRLEITLAIVAAFLTIVGYSLNDTIVVFDRIRENLRLLRREKLERIINVSINQSLSRTVMTSFTTLMVVLILFIFGGEVIRNFAFALLVGVVVGTYSSVFVASPILVEWEKKREMKKGRGKRR
jgi:preprotein translocase subunit SecF